jgi:hypothetical protein
MQFSWKLKLDKELGREVFGLIHLIRFNDSVKKTLYAFNILFYIFKKMI